MGWADLKDPEGSGIGVRMGLMAFRGLAYGVAGYGLHQLNRRYGDLIYPWLEKANLTQYAYLLPQVGTAALIFGGESFLSGRVSARAAERLETEAAKVRRTSTDVTAVRQKLNELKERDLKEAREGLREAKEELEAMRQGFAEDRERLEKEKGELEKKIQEHGEKPGEALDFKERARFEEIEEESASLLLEKSRIEKDDKAVDQSLQEIEGVGDVEDDPSTPVDSSTDKRLETIRRAKTTLARIKKANRAFFSTPGLERVWSPISPLQSPFISRQDPRKALLILAQRALTEAEYEEVAEGSVVKIIGKLNEAGVGRELGEDIADGLEQGVLKLMPEKSEARPELEAFIAELRGEEDPNTTPIVSKKSRARGKEVTKQARQVTPAAKRRAKVVERWIRVPGSNGKKGRLEKVERELKFE